MTARSSLALSHRCHAWLLFSVLMVIQGCGPQEEQWPVRQECRAVHTVCGGPNTVEGVDVSKWQEVVDWPSVKDDGIVFAYAKVNDGLNTPDAYFNSNWTKMKEAGIIRGVYQFLSPSQDPVAQATFLIQEVQSAGGLEAGDLPPVIALEKTEGISGVSILAKVDLWLDTIKQAFNRTPIFYSGSYFWDENLVSSDYASYPLWVPNYTTDACPLVPDPWQEWKFWQYTESATVAGINGETDVNRFNGTQTELQAFIASSFIQPPQDAGPLLPDSSVADAGAIRDGTIQKDDQGVVQWTEAGQPWPDGDLPPSTDYEKDRPDDSGCTLAPHSASAESPAAMLMVLALLLVVFWRRRKRV